MKNYSSLKEKNMENKINADGIFRTKTAIKR